jgi:hypothetical protein
LNVLFIGTGSRGGCGGGGGGASLREGAGARLFPPRFLLVPVPMLMMTLFFNVLRIRFRISLPMSEEIIFLYNTKQ